MHTTRSRRIVIVGTSGSGKSHFSKRISMLLGLPRIELDALNWERDWTEAPLSVFRSRVVQAVAAPSWIVDGNYGHMGRELIWPHADTIVWLDYSLPFTLLRSLRRTLYRIFSREPLWAGNRESIRRAFFSKDSILLWVLKSHGRRRREYSAFFANADSHGPRLIRCRSTSDTELFLAFLCSSEAGDRLADSSQVAAFNKLSAQTLSS